MGFVVLIESMLNNIHKSWFDLFVLGFLPLVILLNPSKTFNHLVGVVPQVHHLKQLFWWRLKLYLFLLPGIWCRKI
jgi:hypothetical protein